MLFMERWFHMEAATAVSVMGPVFFDSKTFGSL